MIDTVDLYFIKARQRRLSLRFLYWYLFREVIQTETHDSIEDARCALKLLKKYNEFEEQGIFDQKLEEIYKEGRSYVCIDLEIILSFLSNWDYRTSNLRLLLEPRLLIVKAPLRYLSRVRSPPVSTHLATTLKFLALLPHRE